jgi:eukaryotic-like serine/threonine-protein kinase
MSPIDPTLAHAPQEPAASSEAAWDAGMAAAFTAGETGSHHPTTDPEAGTILAGKYRLSERIGEGGMGSVWVAHQSEPVKRKVAVKLIKPGMDSKQVLARFEAERQALAVMDHPNIAKVLDGGLHEGRPFFVMELVKGVPITEYCDANKLTPKQRLELFVPVCQAIQHAHQKGIIHRDIKPSNVLIALYDDKPVPKVIDFGIAKATGGTLTEQTIETQFGGVVGTPQYMSPEQASLNNLDIDTRSDVYSLGVLLYELLAGSPPFAKADLEKRGLLEMLRVVREEEPPRPSTKLSTADALPSLSANRGTEPKKLTGLLRNELDWIVMKALEKDRSRRYETANGFATDVLRYLSGEAVQAHPPSVTYRLKKFVRRNKVQVTAASLVILALLAGIVGTTWGMIRADRARHDEFEQRKLAETNERKANDAKVDADTQRAKAEGEKRIALAVKDFLQNKLLLQADSNVQYQSLMKLGGPQSDERVKANPTVRELLDRAARELSEAKIEANFPGQPVLQAELLHKVGLAYNAVFEGDSAKKFLERSLALRKQHLGPDHSDTLVGMSSLASAKSMDTDQIPLLEEVLSRSKIALRPDHPDTLQRMSDLALAYQSANFFGKTADQARQPLPLFEEAFKRSKVALGPDHRDTLRRMSDLGDYLAKSANLDQGSSLMEEAFKLSKGRYGPDDPDTIVLMGKLGTMHITARKIDAAVPLLEEAYKRANSSLGPDHIVTIKVAVSLWLAYEVANKPAEQRMKAAIGNPKAQKSDDDSATGLTVTQLKNLYRSARKWDLLVAVEEEELKHIKAKRGEEHADTLASMQRLGMVYLNAKSEKAVPLFEELFRLQKANLGQDHRDTLATMDQLASVYVRPRPDLAVPLFEELLKLRKAKGIQNEEDELFYLYAMHGLAKAYRSFGKLDLAVKFNEEALKGLKAKSGQSPANIYSMGWEHLAYRVRREFLEIYVQVGEKSKGLALLPDLLAYIRKYALNDSQQLALFYAQVGRSALQLKAFAEAEPLLRDCLTIREKYGPDVWSTFNVQSMLGGALLGQKKYADAEPLLLKGYEGMKARETTIPTTGESERLTAQAIDRLVELYTVTNKPDEVKKWRVERAECVKRMVERARRSAPAHSSQLAGQLGLIGRMLLEAKSFTEAEPLLRECLAIREKSQPDSWLTFNTQSMLGGALLGQKNYADAEAVLLKGYEGMKARENKVPQFDGGELRIPQALDRLIELYTATNKPDEAKKWRAERAKYPEILPIPREKK